MATVKKRSWKTAAGEEKTAWVVRYADQTGKWRLKTFDAKKEADAYRQTVEHQVSQGVHTPDSTSLTVKEAGEKWLDKGRLDGLEETTIEQREMHLRLHINPRIGGEKISRLTTPRIQAFADDLLRGGDTTKAISRPLAVKVLNSLRMMLTHAQRSGRVAQNVALPVKIDMRDRDEEDVEIPTGDELRGILASAKGRWRPLILTAAFSGMRASELRGLRWVDVDFEKRSIRVTQRADKFGTIGSPKSKTSRRDIPMTPIVMNTLTEWKKECPKGELGLVFPNKRGNVEMLANIAQRGWGPAQLAAGIWDRTPVPEKDAPKTEDGDPFCPVRPAYGFHALRHHYASMLIAQGFTPKRVQHLLGHSSVVITLDTYTHLWPVDDQDHDKLAEAERKAMQPLAAVPQSGLLATQPRHGTV